MVSKPPPWAVPAPDYSFREEIFTDIQTEPPLVQLGGISMADAFSKAQAVTMIQVDHQESEVETEKV